MGENFSEVDAIVEGEPARIFFNAKYLIDVLGVMSAVHLDCL